MKRAAKKSHTNTTYKHTIKPYCILTRYDLINTKLLSLRQLFSNAATGEFNYPHPEP